MKKFLLVDTQNTFWRSRHAAHQGVDAWAKVGLALHITLFGIKKMWEKFDPDHVVFAAEGRSWRKTVNEDYKRNRDQRKGTETPVEREEMQMFFDMINDFTDYIRTKTNATLLQDEICEADDMIAGWIQAHPNDMCIIISTDKDYIQLIDFNVQVFDPVSELLYTKTGTFDAKGKPAKKKTGELLEVVDPELSLFTKCVKGDVSDNVFSAYPGVRMKSTKKAVGLLEAYEDRHKRGFAWNNFMNTKWTHWDGTERKVATEYQKNQILVDLTKQPEFIKERMARAVDEAYKATPVSMVGVHFLRFANKYELVTLEQNSAKVVAFLTAKLGERENGDS